MNSPFKVGDTVKVLSVKGLSRASAKIIGIREDVANGIELSEAVAGFRFWSHNDLVLFPESRPKEIAMNFIDAIVVNQQIHNITKGCVYLYKDERGDFPWMFLDQFRPDWLYKTDENGENTISELGTNALFE